MYGIICDVLPNTYRFTDTESYCGVFDRLCSDIAELMPDREFEERLGGDSDLPIRFGGTNHPSVNGLKKDRKAYSECKIKYVASEMLRDFDQWMVGNYLVGRGKAAKYRTDWGTEFTVSLL